MFKAVLILVFVAAASANWVNFTPCPGGIPVPTQVWSTHCEPNLCTIRRNAWFNARAYFTPQATFNNLWVRVSVPIIGDIPIPPPHDNACNNLEGGRSCPVHQGENHVWDLYVLIEDIPLSPTVPVRSKLNLSFINK